MLNINWIPQLFNNCMTSKHSKMASIGWMISRYILSDTPTNSTGLVQSPGARKTNRTFCTDIGGPQNVNTLPLIAVRPFSETRKLTAARLRTFELDQIELSECVKHHLQSYDPHLQHVSRLTLMEMNAFHSLWRLKLCPGMFRETVLAIAQFQHNYLDIIG